MGLLQWLSDRIVRRTSTRTTKSFRIEKSDKSFAFHFSGYPQSYIAELADRAQKAGLTVLSSLPAMQLLIIQNFQDTESVTAFKEFERSIYRDMDAEFEKT